jgi:hypothetical protein
VKSKYLERIYTSGKLYIVLQLVYALICMVDCRSVIEVRNG